MSDLFADLPWFLQEYVHNNRWTSFRNIQLDTYEAFCRTEGHILISAGTSSGKTEAAMFPIIASVYGQCQDGISVLYVGPLKALIDDQFERIEPILRDSGIKITGWHGDISQYRKQKTVKGPSGILQITPESLQNIVTNRRDELTRLFGNLRYVVIDEVHAFMNSERGLQLLCCLEVLERTAGCRPRRLGLSATISDKDSACGWLSANTGRDTAVVSDDSIGSRTIGIRYNLFPSDKDDGDNYRQKAVTRYYRELYSDISGRSCIVFANSRDSAEKTAHGLSKMAELAGRPGNVFIHHGSVSRELRHNAEEALKDRNAKNTVVSTVTLELGIDIGNLDRIVQIGPPYTCSSLVQRMGRSGRRGEAQNLVLYCNDDLTRYWTEIDGMSVDLLRSIAMTELVLKDRWVESPSVRTLPYGLLYHQTLQYLIPGTGAKFKELADNVLSLYPFRNIDRNDYRTLLRHMVKTGQLERMEDGTLLIGDKGERMAFNREFCAVFSTGREFDISFEGKVIGSVQVVPSVGTLIQLAGRVWEVTEVEAKEHRAKVIESDGTANTPWTSGIPGIDTMVLRKMKEILMGTTDYPYLDEEAKKCLAFCRRLGYEQEWTKTFSRRSGGYRIYPWMGSRRFDTLKRALLAIPDVDRVRCRSPYYIDVATDLSEYQLRSWVNEILETTDGRDLVSDTDDLQIGKYDEHVPESLLIKQFLRDELDTGFEL